MLEIKIPAEIRDYKSKQIWGLTTRNLIAIGGAIVTCVPVGVFGRGRLPADIIGWIIIGLVVPFAAWGFIPIQGMPFEDYAKAFYEYYVLPQKRVYKDSDCNLFIEILADIGEEDIIEQKLASGVYELDD